MADFVPDLSPFDLNAASLNPTAGASDLHASSLRQILSELNKHGQSFAALAQAAKLGQPWIDGHLVRFAQGRRGISNENLIKIVSYLQRQEESSSQSLPVSAQPQPHPAIAQASSPVDQSPPTPQPSPPVEFASEAANQLPTAPEVEEAEQYRAVFKKKGKKIINYPRAFHSFLVDHGIRQEPTASSSKQRKGARLEHLRFKSSASSPDQIVGQDAAVTAWTSHLRMLLFQLNLALSEDWTKYTTATLRNDLLAKLVILDTSLWDLSLVFGLSHTFDSIDLLKAFQQGAHRLDDSGDGVTRANFESHVIAETASVTRFFHRLNKSISKAETTRIQITPRLDTSSLWTVDSTRKYRLLIIAQNVVLIKLDLLLQHFHVLVEHRNEFPSTIFLLMCRTVEDYIQRFNYVLTQREVIKKEKQLTMEKVTRLISASVAAVQSLPSQ